MAKNFKKNNKRRFNKNGQWKPKSNNQQNNFQDKFSDKEYDKGFNAGKKYNGPISPIMGGPGSKDNDPIWYSLSKEVTDSVANISFKQAVGLAVAEVMGAQSGSSTQLVSFMPGIMTINFVPSIGQADLPTDGTNVAAFNTYSYIRHKNSGQPVGDAPNYEQYLIAMDSAYMYFSELTRVYGIINNWSISDRYTPEALVVAMGYDYNDLVQNLADFRALINTTAMRLGIFAVPSEIAFIKRHHWMTENVYTDSETSKAQYYLYIPEAYYGYTEGVPGVNGAVLSLIKRPKSNTHRAQPQNVNVSSFMDIKTFIDTLLGPIFGSEDLNTMAGDLLKAFGTSGLYQVNQIAETYTVVPSYSREVLSQIENAYILPSGDTEYYGQITEATGINEGYLVEMQGIRFTEKNSSTLMDNFLSMQPANRFINFHWDNPTPDDVNVATELATTYVGSETFEVNSKTYNRIISSRAEVVVGATIWSMTQGAILYPRNFASYLVYDATSTTELISDVAINSALLCAISAFDWHPRVYLWRFGSNNSKSCFGGFQDIDNFAWVSRDVLENINEAALLSLFAVRNEEGYSIK